MHLISECTLFYIRYGTILSGSSNGTAKVWSDKECVSTLSGHLSRVSAVVILPEVRLTK